MKNNKIALILHIINLAFVLFGVIVMFFNINYMHTPSILEASGVEFFKFYTVDSNILMGIVSMIDIIYLILILKNKVTTFPKYLKILNLVATTAVGVTFFTVVLFLAPFLGVPFYLFFTNGNLVFHLLVPVLSMVIIVLYMDLENITMIHTLFNVSTVFLYGIFYVITVLTHMVDGKVSYEYDWYGFAQGGPVGIIFSIIIMLSGCYLIGMFLYLLNKKIKKLKEKA